jgi:hypothetical protein
MEIWVIALLVIAGVLALLFVGGVVANARLHAREDDRHARRIADADRALAAARAEDRGWNRTALETAARTALEARGVQPTALELIRVVDRPGTDEDRARFRARTAEGFVEIELARMGDSWEPAQ